MLKSTDFLFGIGEETSATTGVVGSVGVWEVSSFISAGGVGEGGATKFDCSGGGEDGGAVEGDSFLKSLFSAATARCEYAYEWYIRGVLDPRSEADALLLLEE